MGRVRFIYQRHLVRAELYQVTFGNPIGNHSGVLIAVFGPPAEPLRLYIYACRGATLRGGNAQVRHLSVALPSLLISIKYTRANETAKISDIRW
jgi:hypothetical protein